MDNRPRPSKEHLKWVGKATEKLLDDGYTSYYSSSNITNQQKLTKLDKEIKLAGDAVIGLGVALKRLEERRLKIEDEILQTKPEPTMQQVLEARFMAEFGEKYNDYDWHKAPDVVDKQSGSANASPKSKLAQGSKSNNKDIDNE